MSSFAISLHVSSFLFSPFSSKCVLNQNSVTPFRAVGRLRLPDKAYVYSCELIELLLTSTVYDTTTRNTYVLSEFLILYMPYGP